MTLNANSSLTYLYSSSLPVEAWLVDMKTYKKVPLQIPIPQNLNRLFDVKTTPEVKFLKPQLWSQVVSNKCSFSPPTTARKALTPISQLKIAEKEGRRIDRAIEYLPPGEQSPKSQTPKLALATRPD